MSSLRLFLPCKHPSLDARESCKARNTDSHSRKQSQAKSASSSQRVRKSKAQQNRNSLTVPACSWGGGGKTVQPTPTTIGTAVAKLVGRVVFSTLPSIVTRRVPVRRTLTSTCPLGAIGSAPSFRVFEQNSDLDFLPGVTGRCPLPTEPVCRTLTYHFFL